MITSSMFLVSLYANSLLNDILVRRVESIMTMIIMKTTTTTMTIKQDNMNSKNPADHISSHP